MIRSYLALFVVLITLPNGAYALWESAILYTDMAQNQPAARITNNNGYTLDIYKSSVNELHLRFSLPASSSPFDHEYCPTYQVDEGLLANRGTNGSRCRITETGMAAEFLLAVIDRNKIDSPLLWWIINGNQIVFRIRLADRNYTETAFSLAGSKKTIDMVVIRERIIIEDPRQTL